jgi:DNA (cytosine-5)-methyltransferase 1
MSAWEDAVTMAGRPILIDFFCCEGGASTGYHRAGFDVFGVDIEPQPNYPFPFHQGDALDVLRRLIDGEAVPFTLPDGRIVLVTLDMVAAIAASPPCQAHSTITPDKSKHVDLIPQTRELLVETGLPYIIENVEGAKRELIDPVMLCGSSFALRVRRHRMFESNVYLTSIPCAHGQQGTPVGVYGDHADGFSKRPNGTSRGVKAQTVPEAREVMGMPWATWHGTTQAIPPAYTEYLGAQLIRSLAVAS